MISVAQPLHDMGTEDIFPQQTLDNIARPYRPQQLAKNKFKHYTVNIHNISWSAALAGTVARTASVRIEKHENTSVTLWEIAMDTVYTLYIRVKHIRNQSGRMTHLPISNMQCTRVIVNTNEDLINTDRSISTKLTIHPSIHLHICLAIFKCSLAQIDVICEKAKHLDPRWPKRLSCESTLSTHSISTLCTPFTLSI